MKPRVSIIKTKAQAWGIPVLRVLGSRVHLEVIFNGLRTESDEPGFSCIHTEDLNSLNAGFQSNGRVSSVRDTSEGRQLLGHLREFRPAIVVSDEMGLSTLQAQLYCRLTGAQLVIWSDSTAHSEGWVSRRRKSIRRHFVRAASRFWTSGQDSQLLLESYGAPPDRIDPGITAGNVQGLISEVDDNYLRHRNGLRRSLGVDGTTFCFAGELSAHHGIYEYLEALRCLKSVSTRPFSAVFAGDGSERGAMQEWSHSTGVPLIITEPRDRMGLAALLAAADVFVFPTLGDNWAAATLSAACAGLPQIFSKFNGATRDLIAIGAPGIVVNPYDVNSLTGALVNYVTACPERVDHGTRKKIARVFSPEACADRMCASIESGLKIPAGSISEGEEVSVLKPEQAVGPAVKGFGARA
jgi:glycosyltransferase involved in cell wall biosynthesis